MLVPFGVGVGDFIAVAKLIGQIVVELQEVPAVDFPLFFGILLTLQNGEAALAYQSLLLELEALSRALHQLQTFEPTKHELLQLSASRATALTCQQPLEDFLAKISSFEGRLDTLNVKNNKSKGFRVECNGA